MNWLNIFPLIKDSSFLKMASDEELMSLWIPSEKIAAISFGRKKESRLYVIEIIFKDSKTPFNQEFEDFDEAHKVWYTMQMSLGIRVPKKRGPKPKFFENLKGDDLCKSGD